MAMFVKATNQFSPLFKEKTTGLCRKNRNATSKQVKIFEYVHQLMFAVLKLVWIHIEYVV